MRIDKRFVCTACILGWLTGMSPASADTPVTYKDGDRSLFSFSVPDFWTLRTGGPREIDDTELADPRAVARVMGLRPVTDDNVWMGFVSPAGVATIGDGLRYLQDIDKFLVKEPTITSSSDTRIGGLPARVIRGTGTREGRGINFTATIIDLPQSRVAVAVAILRDGADPAYAEVLNDVFASFRAAR